MRFHLNLPVRDIEATTRFYRQLFGEAPVKQKDDYVKFLPSTLALNISFHRASDETIASVRSAHVGLEFSDMEELDAVHARLQTLGLIEGARETSICCYARQDKFRVVDPDGYDWELYALLEDTAQKIEAGTGCCGATQSDSEAASTPACC